MKIWIGGDHPRQFLYLQSKRGCRRIVRGIAKSKEDIQGLGKQRRKMEDLYREIM